MEDIVITVQPITERKNFAIYQFCYFCDGGGNDNKQQIWNNFHLKNLYNRQGNSLGACISAEKISADFIFCNFGSTPQIECNKVR